MKKLSLVLGLLLPLLVFSQDEIEVVLSVDSLDVQVLEATDNTDSIQWIILERDPEVDALVAYYKKKDPPQITIHRGEFGRTWWNPRGGYTYYSINGQKVTRGGVEEYLGEVAPIAYKDFSRGRQIRRAGAKWLYIGLGGYLLALTSQNETIQNLGFGTLIAGGTISLGCLIAGGRRQQRGINHYNMGF